MLEEELQENAKNELTGGLGSAKLKRGTCAPWRFGDSALVWKRKTELGVIPKLMCAGVNVSEFKAREGD